MLSFSRPDTLSSPTSTKKICHSLLFTVACCASTLQAQTTESPTSTTPPDPVTIKRIVAFGNSHSDTGNTSELFDELAGRKAPKRLREEIQYHAPDMVSAASALGFSALVMAGVHAKGWDQFLQQVPFVRDHLTVARGTVISYAASLLYKTGAAHYLAFPINWALNRSDLLLNALLWFYPSVGLPILPPGSLYDSGGRFTNGHRIWAEMLATRLGLNPDTDTEFQSLAYAGSHVRAKLSKADILSFSKWLEYITAGHELIESLEGTSATEAADTPLLNIAAHNMSKDGWKRFENLLTNDIPPSFTSNIEEFADKQLYPEHDPDSTLFSIMYGADDYIVDEAEPDDVTRVIRSGINTLISRDGAKHFLINKLSHLDQLPAMNRRKGTTLEQILDKIEEHNTLLEQMVSELQERFPDIQISLLDTGERLHSEADRRGLTAEPCLTVLHSKPDQNSTNDFTAHYVPTMTKHTIVADDIIRSGSSLQATYRLFGQWVGQCNQPDDHLFYDDFNLTSRGHQIFADLACEQLAKDGYACQ